MFRKIAILLPVFFFCLGLDNCRSPEAPEKPKNEYRYNVKVIYTPLAEDFPEGWDDAELYLYYCLRDPALGWESWWLDQGSIKMNKIGKNKFRCYLHKVFIQVPNNNPGAHRVFVYDFKTHSGHKVEKIDIEGAYGQYITKEISGTYLCFKMSKN